MTVTEDRPSTQTGTGRVVRVTGPVVDVEFPRDAMPDLFNALEVEEVDEFRDERDEQLEGERTSEVPTSYEFEPSAEALLDALLPKYITTRIYAAMLEAAASESASRRRAMKSASDNAEELAKNLSRQANQARQAEITQEISEIVGGSEALVTAGSDN